MSTPHHTLQEGDQIIRVWGDWQVITVTNINDGFATCDNGEIIYADSYGDSILGSPYFYSPDRHMLDFVAHVLANDRLLEIAKHEQQLFKAKQWFESFKPSSDQLLEIYNTYGIPTQEDQGTADEAQAVTG